MDISESEFKKVVVISAFIPSKDNMGAPTALPYQILKNRPENIEIYLYCYPHESEKFNDLTLGDIKKLQVKKFSKIEDFSFTENFYNKRYVKQYKLPPSIRKFPVKRNIVKEISKISPDVVWLYPHWLINWATCIKCNNIIVTGPDSAVLHYERYIRFGNWTSLNELEYSKELLEQNIHLEKNWAKLNNVRIHMVGKADILKYTEITSEEEKSFFVPHPHYDFLPIENQIIDADDKIHVIISGGGEKTYVGNHLPRIVDSLVLKRENLSKNYKIEFIGAGVEKYVKSLSDCGYSVSNRIWVDKYDEVISRAHIQIFPIAVGTGTKGKVLHALATGLLGIGSKFAFENIQLEKDIDYLQYNEPEDIIFYLNEIIKDKEKYTQMAKRASEKVRIYHSPQYTAKLFWNKVIM